MKYHTMPCDTMGCHRNLVAAQDLHSTAQHRNLVAAQEAPDPSVLPPAAFLFTKLLFTKVFSVGHKVYLQYSNAVYTGT